MCLNYQRSKCIIKIDPMVVESRDLYSYYFEYVKAEEMIVGTFKEYKIMDILACEYLATPQSQINRNPTGKSNFNNFNKEETIQE
jgi:hypothetical protein